MSNLKGSLANISPKTKQMSVIALAVAVLIGGLYLYQGEPTVHEYYDRKTDKVTNVFSDSNSNRDVTIDALSGQINDLHNQNRELKKEIDKLRQALENPREAAKIRELQSKIESLNDELQSVRNGQTALARNVQRVEQRPIKLRRNAKGEIVDEKGNVLTKEEAEKQAIEQSSVTENPFERTRPQEVVKGDKKRGQAGGVARSALKLNFVEEPEPKAEKNDRQVNTEDNTNFIPAGSIITGTIITGGDFPTAKGSYNNPTPTLIRIKKTAILPNRYTSDIRECFLLVGGHGDLSSERAKLRGEKLSCVRQDGSMIETKLNSYVVGEDGKEGVKGRVVSKQGQMIARSLVAGFASGMSEAFDYNPVPVLATASDGTTQYQSTFTSDAAKGGFAKGASNALEKVADFYMKMAEDIFPVIEINAGRQVDIIVISGTRLDVKAGTEKRKDAKK